MVDERITAEQFEVLKQPLLGLPVSRTWRGYGSAIFFELGLLTDEWVKRKDGTQRLSRKGQAAVMIEWSWRVERTRSVAFGSWDSNRLISNRLAKLQGLTLLDITVEGRLPELVLHLSDGYWVHSFTTVGGQPEWCLFLNQGTDGMQWLTSKQGNLVLTTR